MKHLVIGLLGLLALPLKGQEMNIIQSSINKLFIATDQQDWAGVEQSFAAKVLLDYSSMSGQAAANLSSSEITSAWKTILPGFEHTHHQVSNFIIDEQGRNATAFCYGTANHYLENAGGNVWTVVGSYDFELSQEGKDWKISAMKFNFDYQAGNLALPQAAIDRVAGKPNSPTGAELNKASVRQFFKALETRELDILVELFAENGKQSNPYHSDLFPAGVEGKTNIRAYWEPVFANFGEMRFPIEELYAMEDPSLVYVKYDGSIQLKNNQGYYENNYYSTFKFDEAGKILEYVEIFNPITAARGFGLLDQIKNNPSSSNHKTMKKINFKSDGLTLVGDLYYPADYQEGKSYPALIVSGSWTTVKEQMAGLYAQKLADKGFITLAFDFRNFGESEGEPRFYENPAFKKEDIKNAVTFLQSLGEVDNDKIGAFAVCAGSMYTLMAASEDKRIKSVVTAASWLHDAEAVKLFYGGEEGVNAKIALAQKAKANYAQNGVVDYIPTISTEDEGAAMYGPYDYYLNPERGAIKEWSDDKFAVMSWEDWLTTDPMPSAKHLSCPTLMIHSDGAVLPQYTKNYFENIAATDKRLIWIDTEMDSPFHQFNFYDQEAEVNRSVEEASKWFAEKL